MASKVMASTALFLSFNLLFLAFLVSSHDNEYQSNNPGDASNGVIDISLGLLNGKGLGNFHHLPHDDSKRSATNSNKPVVNLPAAAPGTAHNHQGKSTCKLLNLGVCASLLDGAVRVEIGNVPTRPCCSLIQDLADLEAAVCLCAAIRANVLGIKLNLPISLSVLFSNCGREVPYDYRCAL